MFYSRIYFINTNFVRNSFSTSKHENQNRNQVRTPTTGNFRFEIDSYRFGWKCYRKLNSLFKHQLWQPGERRIAKLNSIVIISVSEENLKRALIVAKVGAGLHRATRLRYGCDTIQ